MLEKSSGQQQFNTACMVGSLATDSDLQVKAPEGMPHLGGPAAHLRQAMAASFVDGLEHIVEIGGHESPVSDFLRHVPQSFTCIDPKAKPIEADTLNGHSCKLRHITRKFQDVELDLEAGSYGLVMVGYSLKPYGDKDPVGEKLFSLIDRSAITVIEYAKHLERANSQIPHILARPNIERLACVDFSISDGVFEATEYGERQLLVLKPAQTGRDV